MAVAAVPRRHRSLLGALIDAAPAISRAGARLASVAREHAGSFVAFGLADAGACKLNAAAGLIVIGASVLVLDWLVRG